MDYKEESDSVSDKICVGDLVILENDIRGYVLFIGPVMTRKGYVLMYGVETTSERDGRCDGTFGGRRYFWTKPEQGLIIPRKKIIKIGKSINGKRITVNDRVRIPGRKQGTIRFVGPTLFGPHVWYGVELDNKIGRSNGSVNGIRYFHAKPQHGLFTREEKMGLVDGSEQSIIPHYDLVHDRDKMALDLYTACANGDSKSVSSILELDPSVAQNAIDPKRHVSALMTASYQGFDTIVTSLLATHQVDLNAGNADGMTALHMASQSGHDTIVKMLIDAGGNVNDIMTDGSTALLLATSLGALDTVACLLEHHADVNRSREDGTSPLIFASSHGHLSIVLKLVETPSVNINHFRTHDRATALFTACRHGHSDCVAELLKHPSIDINLMKSNGRSPLFIAAFFGNVDIVEKLLDFSSRMARQGRSNNTVNINQPDVKGFTPLFVAAQNGHVQVVKLLLSHDADVNKAEQRGHSPLWISSLRGHIECVKLLLSHPHIQIDSTDQSGVSPLWAAAQNDNADVVELLLDPSRVVLKRDGSGSRTTSGEVRQGADPNLAKHDGCTPLWIAAGRGNTRAIQKLLKFGASINQKDRSQGATPLFVACQNGHRDAVEMLVENNAEINISRAGDGTTPLMMAAHNGHVDIAHVLLDHSADPTTMNRSGLNGLACAAMQGHAVVVGMIYHTLSMTRTVEDVQRIVNDVDENNGWTALHLASMSGHVSVVRFLVDSAKVDVMKKDHEGHTALWHAKDQNHAELIDFLETVTRKITMV